MHPDMYYNPERLSAETLRKNKIIAILLEVKSGRI